MIDFNNSKFVKLKPIDANQIIKTVGDLLIDGEQIVYSFQAMRDSVVFTDKRVISINVQGLTGTKKDFTSLPYSKVQAYSVETAGLMDLDAELELWFSGLGKVKFEFTSGCDIYGLEKMLSYNIL